MIFVVSRMITAWIAPRVLQKYKNNDEQLSPNCSSARFPPIHCIKKVFKTKKEQILPRVILRTLEMKIKALNRND